WLVWVFARQTGGDALAILFGAGLLLALGLWLGGRHQAARAFEQRGLISGLAALIVLILALGLTVIAARSAPLSGLAQVEASGPLASQPWSPETVQTALAEGRPVLVN